MTIDRETILQAQARIAGDVRHTPLWRIPGAAVGIDLQSVWLKLEHLQISGSFKARGMFNRMRSATLPAAGVTIASGGNAGIAVATAARALGVQAEVFIPAISSPAKQAALAALGAKVVVKGDAYADALALCIERQKESGALLMHAYDQAEVVAGAGTLAVEIEADFAADVGTGRVTDLATVGRLPDRVLVSVGGGGLIGGIAAWFGARARVEAIEPVLAPTLHAARAAGEPVDVSVAGIAADALGARRIGAIAWEITQRHLAASHLVDDAAIRAAQLTLWRELRLAVEPSASLPLAALQTGVVKPSKDERVVLVICGANLDPASLN